MNGILVDTSVIIDFLRRKDKEKSYFYKIFEDGVYVPVLSLVVVSELWAGKSMASKVSRKKVEKLLERCEIVFPTVDSAKRVGELLRSVNYEVSFQDVSIAVDAIENNLELLTMNKKDFEKIDGLKLKA